MTWEIEVIAVRTSSLDLAVPDVLVESKKKLRFGSATSRVLSRGIGATIVGPWAVALDIDCHVSRDTTHLRESSRSTDLHLVRIAADPIALHWRDGQPITEARGLDECLALAPREDRDGEISATELLRQWTGLRFPIDLWTAQFTFSKPAR